MARDLQSIIADFDGQFRTLLQEAFEAGRAAGRDDASAELRGKLANILGDNDIPMTTSRIIEPARIAVPAEGRAVPGTVKPTILRLVQNAPGGLTTAEIVSRTGIKKNSVRGTLHNLKTDRAVERRGDRWFVVPQKIEAADLLSSRASAASDNPTSGPVKPAPGGGT